MRVTIYTDGAARGNPGPGGYGAVMHYVDPAGNLHVKELTEGFRRTTNNRMELLGVIVALECLRRPCTIDLYSDSKYVVDAFNQHWVDGWLKRGWKNAKKEPVKNADLWKRLLEAKKNHQVTFHWVKGHAGHPENERCDELATGSADGGPLLVDEGFERSTDALSGRQRRTRVSARPGASDPVHLCGIAAGSSLRDGLPEHCRWLYPSFCL